MKIIMDTLSIDELKQMAADKFGDMVKAVIESEAWKIRKCAGRSL